MHLSNLPVEVLTEVLSNLDVGDVVAASGAGGYLRDVSIASDKQLFKQTLWAKCDETNKLLPCFGCRTNSEIRRFRIRQGLERQQQLSVTGFTRASIAPTGFVPYFSIWQSPRNDDDDVDGRHKNEQVHVTEGEVFHLNDGTILVCTYDPDGNCRVRIQDSEKEEEEVSIGQVHPLSFELRGSKCIMAEFDDRTRYYSYPAFRLLGEDADCADTCCFVDEYLVKFPRNRHGALQIRPLQSATDQWLDALRIDVSAFHQMRLNNFATSDRHILFTMTRRDAFAYSYLVVWDAVAHTANGFLHAGPLNASVQWLVSWDGQVHCAG